MKNTLVIVYILICLLCLTFLGSIIIFKRWQKKGIPPVLISTEDLLKENDMKDAGAEDLSDFSFLGKSFTRKNTGGREDPFRMLPQESKQDDNIQLDNINNEKSDYGSYVRGIVYGKSPIAIVEEQGVYRKVKVGDFFNGGKIVAITEKSVIIIVSGEKVSMNLGE